MNLLRNEAKFVHKLVYTCPEFIEGLILGLGIQIKSQNTSSNNIFELLGCKIE